MVGLRVGMAGLCVAVVGLHVRVVRMCVRVAGLRVCVCGRVRCGGCGGVRVDMIGLRVMRLRLVVPWLRLVDVAPWDTP